MLTKEDYSKAKYYGISEKELNRLVYRYKATTEQVFRGERKGKGLKYIRMDTVRKNGIDYTITLKRTGSEEPHQARITVSKWYYDCTGGLKGWETVDIYDQSFKDWNYAHLLYKRMKGESECLIKN